MKTTILGLILLLAFVATLAKTQEAKPPSAPPVPVEVLPAVQCSGRDIGDGWDECEKRDVARLFLAAGQTETAVRVLCATKGARDAMGERCLQVVGLEPKKGEVK